MGTIADKLNKLVENIGTEDGLIEQISTALNGKTAISRRNKYCTLISEFTRPVYYTTKEDGRVVYKEAVPEGNRITVLCDSLIYIPCDATPVYNIDGGFEVVASLNGLIIKAPTAVDAVGHLVLN